MADNSEKIIQLSEAQQPFSKYPEEINNYFKDNNIVISAFPEFLWDKLKEPNSPDTAITSMDQYETFLKTEYAFWLNEDWRNKLSSWHFLENLRQAKSYFDQTERYLANKDYNSAKNAINTSITQLRTNILCSKTTLAQTLWKYHDKDQSFFDGFLKIANKHGGNNTIGAYEFEGALAAYFYLNETAPLFSSSQFANLKGQATKVNQNYADLNRQYLDAFHEQEKRLAEIANSNDQHLKSLTEKSENFWNENASRRDELEKVYREKLRLEAPAQYWDNMAKKYSTKGTVWLWVSIVIAAIIISVLVLCFFYMPMEKSAEVSLFGIVRNYMILTATVGIGVYMLRLFVRMCMSCYHQARDAEERSKLASFYLALIEKGAVTDKERALVINSLFSRADTGLLKGDSTPVMSQNVTELVDAVIKK